MRDILPQPGRPPRRGRHAGRLLAAVLSLAAGGVAVPAFEADTVPFCAGPEPGELCAALPQDVPEFDPNFSFLLGQAR